MPAAMKRSILICVTKEKETTLSSPDRNLSVDEGPHDV